jgi:hypothetical protein
MLETTPLTIPPAAMVIRDRIEVVVISSSRAVRPIHFRLMKKLPWSNGKNTCMDRPRKQNGGIHGRQHLNLDTVFEYSLLYFDAH